MREMIINQGLPGSGKTYASELLVNSLRDSTSSAICSADHYHVDIKGKYVYNPKNEGEAHAWCLKTFVSAIREDVNLVIVDNTNITRVDMAPYAALARAYEYDLRIIRYECAPQTSITRNTHGVSEFIIGKMWALIETPLSRWAELETINTDGIIITDGNPA